VVHRALRRELGLAGAAVRRVADGDTARSAVVGDHLDLVLRMLHHHHELEDVMVWPPLRERAGEEVLPLVDLMEAQHRQVVELMGGIESRLPSWAAGADAAAGEEVAVRCDQLHAALVEHLDLEEAELLGVAEAHITEDEWHAMGAEAEQAFRGRERTLVLGILQHEGDPEVLASMLGPAPAPVRFLVPRLARRAFRHRAAAVHGTRTP
jgi:hemerythrin-like domain-containing protein